MSGPRTLLESVKLRSRELHSPIDGGTMIWREWGMDNNVKPPLILLHGGSGAWNHWVRNIPSLEQHHRLLVADLPGCGDSDDPPRPYDSESLAAMISDSIDHILPGNTPFALLSFSFGGVLSGLIAYAQA